MMPRALPILIRDPVLRAVTAVVFLNGAFAATFAPYQSRIAIGVLGMGDRAFAACLVLAALVGVTAAVGIGILTDRGLDRRRVALVCGAMLLAGALAMIAVPGVPAFLLAHALLWPAAALFGQSFALARIAALAHPPDRRPALLAAIRAVFALPFVVVLPLWSLVFAAGGGLLAIYPALAVTALALLAALWALPAHLPGGPPASGLGPFAALAEMARPHVALRVVLLGGITAAMVAYMVLVGLLFDGAAGRGDSDVALFVGGVAGLEVPFMLLVPALLRRYRPTGLIALGALLYGGWLALLPALAPTPFVWLLILPAAMAGAVVLTLPIGYLQDLLSDRPGAGSALMAVQGVTGQGLSAGAFALGTALSGYGLVAGLAAALAVTGGIGLWLADRAAVPRM